MRLNIVQALIDWVNTEALVFSTRLNPRKAWQTSLLKLLKQSKDTELGRRYGLSSRMTIEEFRSAVPVLSFVKIEKWIFTFCF
jgi:hypothetical protein